MSLMISVAVPAGALRTSARAAVLMDAATGVVLYAQNENEPRAMASTTKIMTALLVLESGDLDKAYTVTAADAAVEGSALGMKAGEVLSVRALLTGLMLVSGNDTAHALANALCASQEAFVERMNQKAKQLGLKHTHFTNPAGLSDAQHYSTALDMAVLTAAALRNPLFAALCRQQKAEVDFIKPQKSVAVYNHNRLLAQYSGCIGVKTGYTQAAGRCLVSAARRQGQTLIAVTLSDADDWADHKALLDDGFAHARELRFRVREVKIPVAGGGVAHISLSEQEASIRVPEEAAREVTFQICAPRFLYAPVEKGQEVAYLLIMYRSTQLQCIPLYSADAVERLQAEKRSFWERLLHYGKYRNQTSKIFSG